MLDDLESHELLKKIHAGRTAKQVGALAYIAGQEATLESERAKHAALIARRGVAMAKGAVLQRHGQVEFSADTWGDLTAHLSDGEGSNHVPVALGLAWKAVLRREQGELEASLYMLFKAAHLTFPHVRQAIENEQAAALPALPNGKESK